MPIQLRNTITSPCYSGHLEHSSDACGHTYVCALPDFFIRKLWGWDIVTERTMYLIGFAKPDLHVHRYIVSSCSHSTTPYVRGQSTRLVKREEDCFLTGSLNVSRSDRCA